MIDFTIIGTTRVMEVVEFERLLQRRDMFGSKVARQIGPPGRIRGQTAHVAIGRQRLRGALARDDGGTGSPNGVTTDMRAVRPGAMSLVGS